MTFRVPCKTANSPAKFMLSFNNSSSILDDGKGGGEGAKATSKSRALSKELAAQAAEINKDLRIFIS